MDSQFAFKKKIVGIRLFKIGFVPPGLYSTEILAEKTLPVLMLEFGNFENRAQYLTGKFPRIRFGDRWSNCIPGSVRAAALILVTTARIVSRSIRTGRPALLVSHGIFETVIAYLASRILRINYFCHIHEVYDQTELPRFNIYWWLLFLEGHILRHAELLIFPEEGRAEVYRKRYQLDSSKIRLVFNCPRVRHRDSQFDLRQKYGIPENAYIMGYMGGVGTQNGLIEAIHAVKNIPGLYFLIWGWTDHATLTRLKDTAFRLGITDRIRILGELKDDKWKALSGCDLCYCVYAPCDLRGKHVATASNKLMEAVSCGVPVVTLNRPDFKRIVEPLNLGICVETLTSDAITCAISRLLADPEKRQAISKAERHAYETQLNFEHQFEPVISQFQRWV